MLETNKLNQMAMIKIKTKIKQIEMLEMIIILF